MNLLSWAKKKKKIVYNFFQLDPPKINFEPPKLKIFLKPSLNEFEYNHLDNILVFLNTHTHTHTKNQYDLKYREKNSKPNNKSVIFFILNLKKNHLHLNKFEII